MEKPTEQNFKEQYVSSFICQICQQIVSLPQPLQCPQCQDIYCQDCIILWQQKQKNCPKCRSLTNFQKCSRKLLEILEELRLICPNNCKQSITYKEFSDNHKNNKCKKIPQNLQFTQNYEETKFPQQKEMSHGFEIIKNQEKNQNYYQNQNQSQQLHNYFFNTQINKQNQNYYNKYDNFENDNQINNINGQEIQQGLNENYKILQKIINLQNKLFWKNVKISNYIITEQGYSLYTIKSEKNNTQYQSKQRFSSFSSLHNKLSNIYPGKILPQLPPKHINFLQGKNVIEKQRQRDLELYLQILLEDIEIRENCEIIHFFMGWLEQVPQNQENLQNFQKSNFSTTLYNKLSSFPTLIYENIKHSTFNKNGNQYDTQNFNQIQASLVPENLEEIQDLQKTQTQRQEYLQNHQAQNLNQLQNSHQQYEIQIPNMKKQLSFINKYKQQIFKFLKLLQNQELHLYQQLEKENYKNKKNNNNKEFSSIKEDQDYSENENDDSENSGNYLQQHYNNQIKKQNQLNEKQSNLAQISQKLQQKIKQNLHTEHEKLKNLIQICALSYQRTKGIQKKYDEIVQKIKQTSDKKKYMENYKQTQLGQKQNNNNNNKNNQQQQEQEQEYLLYDDPNQDKNMIKKQQILQNLEMDYYDLKLLQDRMIDQFIFSLNQLVFLCKIDLKIFTYQYQKYIHSSFSKNLTILI